MEKNLIYLDSYKLQQDMRVRMPKSVMANLNLEKGKTIFDIYINKNENSIILKIANDMEKEND